MKKKKLQLRETGLEKIRLKWMIMKHDAHNHLKGFMGLIRQSVSLGRQQTW